MAIVKWFDSKPVKGALMIAVVAAIGAILSLTAPHGSNCSTSPQRHVYQSSRLEVVAKCQTVTFQVVAWRHEHDDDYHVNGIVQGDSSWINDANRRDQHGLTVFEFVPHDPRPATFIAGEVLRVTTTKALDRGHSGWIEGHPIFKADIVSTPSRAAPNNNPRLVPPTEGP